MKYLVSSEILEKRIFILRKQKVMLSTHLSSLYDVEPRILIKAVKRNKDRFPKDFCFQLNDKEYKILKSQFVISSWGGLRRSKPYAFTEHGISMLSSVLNSRKAVQVNIAIIRTFVKLRRIISANRAIAKKLNQLEKRVGQHDMEIKSVFDAIRMLMNMPEKSNKRIGFLR